MGTSSSRDNQIQSNEQQLQKIKIKYDDKCLNFRNTILSCIIKSTSKMPWDTRYDHTICSVYPQSVPHGYNSVECEEFKKLQTYLASIDIALDDIIIHEHPHYMVKIVLFKSKNK